MQIRKMFNSVNHPNDTNSGELHELAKDRAKQYELHEFAKIGIKELGDFENKILGEEMNLFFILSGLGWIQINLHMQFTKCISC